tara:strand:- start:49 stop:276 length:228 start_codon:yes stop_codon:yes gene_type:complete
MQKTRFNNSNIIIENSVKKQTYHSKTIDPKIVVDINKLLNRVKINERNQVKQKIIFFTLLTLGLGAIGIFIIAIK